jgi:hypothetical protein
MVKLSAASSPHSLPVFWVPTNQLFHSQVGFDSLSHVALAHAVPLPETFFLCKFSLWEMLKHHYLGEASLSAQKESGCPRQVHCLRLLCSIYHTCDFILVSDCAINVYLFLVRWRRLVLIDFLFFFTVPSFLPSSSLHFCAPKSTWNSWAK